MGIGVGNAAKDRVIVEYAFEAAEIDAHRDDEQKKGK